MRVEMMSLTRPTAAPRGFASGLARAKILRMVATFPDAGTVDTGKNLVKKEFLGEEVDARPADVGSTCETGEF